MAGTARKLGGFWLAMAVAFAVAYGVGRAAGPVGAEPAAAGHGGMEDMGGHVDAPKGLTVSADGLTLDVRGASPRAGVRTDFAFRILDDRGAPVTRFAPAHDKLMHLVVARRDLSNFRHVHPTMAADGTWRIPLTFAE